MTQTAPWDNWGRDPSILLLMVLTKSVRKRRASVTYSVVWDIRRGLFIGPDSLPFVYTCRFTISFKSRRDQCNLEFWLTFGDTWWAPVKSLSKFNFTNIMCFVPLSIWKVDICFPAWHVARDIKPPSDMLHVVTGSDYKEKFDLLAWVRGVVSQSFFIIFTCRH